MKKIADKTEGKHKSELLIVSVELRTANKRLFRIFNIYRNNLVKTQNKNVYMYLINFLPSSYGKC